MPIWAIVVIEAAFGTAEAFFNPAVTGLVPQTVPEDELQQANAANSIVANAAELVGPAIATALVLGLGAGWAFAFDALTFVISALLLARLRPRSRGERAPRQRMSRRPARRLAGAALAPVGVGGDRRDVGRAAASRSGRTSRSARRSPTTSTGAPASSARSRSRWARGR